jgi:2-C-methyl-D-erythritol 4-phosphate cytidylyltransferase
MSPPSGERARGAADRIGVVVVAGGSGSRFGGFKQFAALAGTNVVERSLAVASQVADDLVLVVPPSALDRAPRLAGKVVGGGDTRSASVRAGLAALEPDADVVVVHDAVRPLASAALFRAVIDAVVGGADAAVPGRPVAETVKRVDAQGRVVATIDREGLYVVQTPQAFRAEALRAAHAGRSEATDDAGLVEAAGGKVVLVPGEPANIKITHPQDLALAEALLAGGEAG